LNFRSFVSNNQNDGTKVIDRGILSTAKLIYQEEGLRGFAKGVIPRILTQAPSAAISWTTYELVKKLLLNQKH